MRKTNTRQPSVRRNSGGRKPHKRSAATGTTATPRIKFERDPAGDSVAPAEQKKVHAKKPHVKKPHEKKATTAGGKKHDPKKKKKFGTRRSQRPMIRTREVHGSQRPSGTKIPAPEKGTFRIIPVGGCEEVGRNMTIFEYEDDIVIIDVGIQFPEEDQPGIDYIVPNTKYLEGKEKNIRGVIFTHGHLDHIGGAPVVLEKLGNPVIVARPLTLALIKHKQEDYKKGTAKKLKIVTVNKLKDTVKLGQITAKFFQVEHSIMDSMGVVLETPGGTVIHPGDWTMERDAKGKTNLRYDQLSKIKNKPTMLMLESLGSLNNDRHGTYEEMYENLQNILRNSPGRTIIATFSSQVERVKWVIEAAKKLGKKVALDGYSMKMNIEIAQKLGYIKIAKGSLIDIKESDKYPENQVVVICTGAQGEENAVLNRIASGTHRTVKLRQHDTVVFSSSIIPGNERTIQRLKDNIYRQCDNVIHGDVMDVHISGHATRQDIMEMIEQIKPDYYVPVYANHFFLKEAKKLATGMGFPDKDIFVPDNGTILEMTKEGVKVRKEKAPSDYVFVDGLGVTDSQHVVLRDRQVLAEDGMVVVIATIRAKSGQLVQNPDIISRGFVFLKDNREVIEAVRHKVKKMIVESNPQSWSDTTQIKNDIRDKVGQLVFTKTQKRPMILPVVIEV
jgi:ribonuclease J